MAKATVDFMAGGEGLRASGSQGPLLSRRAMSDISITHSIPVCRLRVLSRHIFRCFN